MFKQRDEPFLGTIFGFFCITLAILIVWLSNFWLMPFFFKQPDNAGTAGDMFGGITALFSGLAFAGLITTLFMQRRELELQRNELKQTREVFAVQRFEHTFFGLLDLLNKHIQSIEVPYYGLGNINNGQQPHRGRDALEMMAKHLPKQDDKVLEKRGDEWNPEMIEVGMDNTTVSEIISSYDKIYADYLESDLGPYFRLIYNILRLIENTTFDEESSYKNDEAKLTYAKLLRAHLNSSEIKLLMFNCASRHGEKLRPLIVKYAMLKHLKPEESSDNPIICKSYPDEAFSR